MNDVLVTLELESLQNLDGEPSYEARADTLKVVLLNELV